jgi:hypothetical protein
MNHYIVVTFWHTEAGKRLPEAGWGAVVVRRPLFGPIG